jgi:hypothetical protein
VPAACRLLVEEDDNSLIMTFELDTSNGGGSGIMKRFHGRWHVRPHPADPEHASLTTLDQVGFVWQLPLRAGQLKGQLEKQVQRAHAHMCIAAVGRGERGVRRLVVLQQHTPQVSAPWSSAPPYPAVPQPLPRCHVCHCRTWLWASICPLPLTASSSASPATRSRPCSRTSRGGVG